MSQIQKLLYTTLNLNAMDVKWNNVKSLNLQQKATTTANDQISLELLTYKFHKIKFSRILTVAKPTVSKQ